MVGRGGVGAEKRKGRLKEKWRGFIVSGRRENKGGGKEGLEGNKRHEEKGGKEK